MADGPVIAASPAEGTASVLPMVEGIVPTATAPQQSAAEEGDDFVVGTPPPTTSRSTFASDVQENIDDDHSQVSAYTWGNRSVATTILASEVGSHVGVHRNAFLRSFTFQPVPKKKRNTEKEGDENDDLMKGVEDMEEAELPDFKWTLVLADPPAPTRRRRFGRGKEQKLTIESYSGVVELSHLEVGDQLHSINGKKIGPSYNAERAMEFMRTSLQQDHYLSVAVGNDDGSDILVQATILKPHPKLTYEDSGLVVWYWGVLCVKQIDKHSLFDKSVLREGDHIISINDIDCDLLTPKKFEHVFNGLPFDVTLIVRRGKQRWSGKFG